MASDFFIRWFQHAMFTPHFRLPRVATDVEPWRLPAPTQPLLAEHVRLRYRLEPYIRSVFRPLCEAGFPMVAGRRSPPRHAPEPFLFGPSLLVCPRGAGAFEHSPIRLPSDSGWIDFWTGETHAGGRMLRARNIAAALPIFVRAGAILPLASAEPAAPVESSSIELRVYPGADGTLVLNASATRLVRLHWNNRERRLHIYATDRLPDDDAPPPELRVVFVRARHGAGAGACEFPDHVVRADGRPVPPIPAPRRPSFRPPALAVSR